MRRVIEVIGVVFIVFSFLFVGLGSCKETNGGGSSSNGGGSNGGGGGNSGNSHVYDCSSGYCSIGFNYVCCPSSHPYYGGGGYCYETYKDAVRANPGAVIYECTKYF